MPIIVSKDYLTLYNFGFAVPQGLPQVSEDIVSAVPITLRLTGESQEPEMYRAAIVGFSSRLNTIAVPQSFMDWANARYSSRTDTPAPSRLIVEIDRMQAGDMEKYFADAGIEVAGEQADQSRVSGFLSVVSQVVTANGAVISGLAIFILLLSIFLLIQKSRKILRNLMLLGYSPTDVGKYYIRMVAAMNLVVTAVAVGMALFARTFWSGPLEQIGIGGASAWPMLVTALVYMVGVTALNAAVIRRHLLRIWRDNA